MLTAVFDFRTLSDQSQFYQQLRRDTYCPATFGNNLDALWDWLTGGMALPARFELRHPPEDNPRLVPVLQLLAEASQALNGQLQLRFDGHKQPGERWQALLTAGQQS